MKKEVMDEAGRLFFYHLNQSFFHGEESRFSVQADTAEGFARVLLSRDGRSFEEKAKIDLFLHKEQKRAKNAALGKAFALAARHFTSYLPPYGTLIGVRPVKVPLYYLKRGFEEKAILSLLETEFFVSPEKAKLLLFLAKTELSFAAELKEEDVMLYVSIPFCPSRCSYCSFISSSAPAHLALIPKYLELLKWELSLTAEVLKQEGKRLLSVYIGGGTPGILSAEEMEGVLLCIRNHFDLTSLREFSVEMGRPDTITEKKLEVLAKYGVDRISINPQSTCDETLERIGRRHSAKDFFGAMEMAKSFPFAVNCDLISALPGEEPEVFLHSVEDVLRYTPESVTVHALCRKKSAGDRGEKQFSPRFAQAVSRSHDLCINQGLVPYYLYRQKMSDADLENLGFSKAGSLGIYNLAMMEDLCDILACGAGAIGKILPREKGGKIRRFAGFKYPYEYLDRPERIREKLHEMQTCWKGEP